MHSDRWIKYFDDQGALGKDWLAGAISHWCFSERLHGNLARLVPANGRVLDLGCGPGFSAFWLAANGYDVLGIDREPTLIDVARARARAIGVKARFEVGDATDLSKYHGSFDLAYSVGVLEHFDRSTTIELLRQQAMSAKHVLIAIPTPFTRYTNVITDERFYSVRALAEIVKSAGLEPVCRFGYGDIAATQVHRSVALVLPRALLRLAQDCGYAYTIAVAGRSYRCT